ncbi:MAG TPA: sodium:proton antiporter [Firmicutes bacterium]|nr:multicomponent Na+:H+ antiporter subunit [Bacillota bacterium]HHV57747.1 sodium:proton antiporter [Bacillota bacterium]
MDDLVLKTVARLLIPFIQLYGLYVILHGHLSPGGGFAGGVIVAAGFVLYALAFGRSALAAVFPERLSTWLESGGILWYVGLGLVGVFAGGAFLANARAGFPLGPAGRLFSSGLVFLLNLGIGIKVAATIATLFRHLEEE